MKTKYLHKTAVLIIIFLLLSFYSEAFEPAIGRKVLDVQLPVPENSQYQSYLGVKNFQGNFRVSEIDATVVLVEIFSMYCPHCQKAAPELNALFKQIEQNDKYRGKIKLIGIGVGNSDFEVEYFKKTYNIEFPLFSDPDFTIHKMLGEVRTPYFIGVKQSQDGKPEIFMSEAGREKTPEELFDLITTITDL
ncbi:ResA [Desulfamplus magnetovallimortis]|uniref:ResA n=1 Tax=Desulfamplus magnetovallimortis TaxID=1246637 RepID=A0A1W1HFT3_9BACT|nr:redoxin domain-containing protein [Desulfamplus magnetovallimortis]SLM31245.1 ResA [Desulfamplus magnetovallimortis]